jgi:hypothetical protein
MENGPTGPSVMKASLRQSSGEQWSQGAMTQVRASTASGLKVKVLGRVLWNINLGETWGTADGDSMPM